MERVNVCHAVTQRLALSFSPANTQRARLMDSLVLTWRNELMKHFVNIAIFLSLILVTAIAGIAQTATKQEADHSTDLVKQLAAEMARLRLEVTELKFELQQAKVAKLETDLRQLQTSKRELASRHAELQSEIATIDQHLNLPLAAEERVELESAKNRLAEKAPEKLRVEEQRLGQQESELYGQLLQEQGRMQELKERLEKLQNKRGR
jgi:DNA repair exonuclease SbcCD ATPase subunit